MKHLIVFALLVSTQVQAGRLTDAPVKPLSVDCLMKQMADRPGSCNNIYDGKLGEAIEAEKKALAMLNEGADTMFTPVCQDDLKFLTDAVNSMDVMNTPLNQHAALASKLNLLTKLRELLVAGIDQCLVKED